MMSPHRRVAVTSPQTRLAHARRRLRGQWRMPTLDPADADRALELYRVQRGRAVLAVALLFGLVLLLPLILMIWPALDGVRLLGVPVSWLMVGVLPFPVMVWLAWWQLRRAEGPEDHG
jgi:hypothetical protein